MKLSVIIPVYNECGTIGEVIDRVANVKLGDIIKEIIVVDDGSVDGSTDIIREEHRRRQDLMKVHIAPVNLGKGAAIRSGLAYATGDIVIMQDADLELNPEEYVQLIAPILNGRAAVVYGSRFMNNNQGIPFAAALANRGLSLLTNVLYGCRLTDMETAYKVFRRDVISGIQLRADGFEFEPEVTAKVLRAGFTIEEVPISYNPRSRSAGKKVTWRDGIIAVYNLLRWRLF